jgi:TolB-like protein/tetratricopeptide (TPR) repeat protein
VEEESPEIGSPGAVFLSYASEDGPAAERIATALRAAGIEVWFDKEALRGGDVWDRQIRRQIKDCALFVPVISEHSQARGEGYFRLEWTLADQRTQLMGKNRTFIVPVCIDDTLERDADVPDSFVAVQWTRLPGGESSAAFVTRLAALLAPGTPAAPRRAAVPLASAAIARPHLSRSNRHFVWIALAILVLAAVVWMVVSRLRSGAPETARFSPPAHSIAVLPFTNLSGDKEQQYFSDGLTEELLNSLSQINALQVAARTSAFSFGDHPDVTTVAHRLNVAAVLEGSVRRSEHTVRITVQLINAITGFNLWSHSYDRDLSDVLQLQTQIATAVAEALKVKLLGDLTAKIELGNTNNPAALDAYLRGRTLSLSTGDPLKELPVAIELLSAAIRLDANYALAIAERSMAYAQFAADGSTEAAARQNFSLAEADARRAIALAPDLAEAHLALGFVLESGNLNFAQAAQEFDRAAALAPGNAQAVGFSGRFAGLMGHFDAAVAAARRAIVLDPLDRGRFTTLGRILYAARRYRESVNAFSQSLTISPQFLGGRALIGMGLLGLNDLNGARLSCEPTANFWFGQLCLAIVYEKLGRHLDAQAQLTRLRTETGEAASYQISLIYAQWGDRTQALEWLEKALRVRDPGLVELKTDPLMDPLRQEPRFKAVLEALKFPP